MVDLRGRARLREGGAPVGIDADAGPPPRAKRLIHGETAALVRGGFPLGGIAAAIEHDAEPRRLEEALAQRRVEIGAVARHDVQDARGGRQRAGGTRTGAGTLPRLHAALDRITGRTSRHRGHVPVQPV